MLADRSHDARLCSAKILGLLYEESTCIFARVVRPVAQNHGNRVAVGFMTSSAYDERFVGYIPVPTNSLSLPAFSNFCYMDSVSALCFATEIESSCNEILIYRSLGINRCVLAEG